MDEDEIAENLKKTEKWAASEQIKEEKASKEVEKKSEKIIIKEGSMAHLTPPPFPYALKGKRKASHPPNIFNILKQVKMNIPSLDMIKQVPPCAKFLKDLCIVKRGMNIDKNAFLTEKVSSIIENKAW